MEIMPEAIATREANGMSTVFHDVWDGLENPEIVPAHNLLIASPPCQTFSLAGKGAGRAALDEVLEAIELHAYKDPQLLRDFGDKHDPRTALVLAPLAYAHAHRPELIAFEQVPAVLPVWEACADVLREWGYSVETAVLNAEQYGVPQTRKRAILVASRIGEVKLPTPTHSRYYSRDPKRLDPGVLPWISMAEALGWGAKDQPSHTVTAGVHGPTDRWASGGVSVRKALDAKVGGPEWVDRPDRGGVDARTEYVNRFDVEDVAALQTYPTSRGLVGFPRLSDGKEEVVIEGTAYRARDLRDASLPAQAVTEKARSWKHFHEDGADSITVEEAATLQSYPSGWGFTDRPAVTVGNAVGRGLIGGSGAKESVERAMECGRFIPSPHGDGSTYAERTRITVEEAAALQSYPAELRPEEEAVQLQTFPPRPFVWCGTKTKKFLQIGNAVPPVLAHAILSALIND